MFQSRISVIEGHNRDNRTDELYEPLRKTFLLDTTAKKSYLEDISRVSHLSKVAKIHTYVENHKLGQQTLIPEDVRLRPTHDLSKVPLNRHYCIVNAEERVLEPISAEEFQSRFRQKEQVIVYTYGDEEPPKDIKQLDKVKVQDKPIVVQPPLKRRNSYLKVTQPKYNLFSIIDEPLNNLFSGGPCTCPANQIVASQRNQINWENAKKYDD